MEYSVQTLMQVADCDMLLSLAAKEKADLTFKQLSEERLMNRYATTSQEIAAALQGVIAEIAATETIISVLPDGPAKEDAIDKKTRLEYKKFVLETRRENYGNVALLEKEMELARVQRELDEVDVFVRAVDDRRNVLA
jgi:hypothetical protein